MDGHCQDGRPIRARTLPSASYIHFCAELECFANARALAFQLGNIPCKVLNGPRYMALAHAVIAVSMV